MIITNKDTSNLIVTPKAITINGKITIVGQLLFKPVVK